MRSAILLTAVMVTALLLSACSIHKSETGSAVSVQNLEETAATETEEGDPELIGLIYVLEIWREGSVVVCHPLFIEFLNLF